MSIRSRRLAAVHTDDPVLQQVQANVASALKAAEASPVGRSEIIKGVSLLSSGTTTVSHKLGRDLVGWIVIRRGGGAAVWDEQATNALASKTLTLRCANDVTVDLLVF